jgi:hypothetical protein
LQGTLGQFLTSITEEERRLIESEGMAVPLTGTLSVNQNKELKRMRRKVKVGFVILVNNIILCFLCLASTTTPCRIDDAVSLIPLVPTASNVF